MAKTSFKRTTTPAAPVAAAEPVEASTALAIPENKGAQLAPPNPVTAPVMGQISGYLTNTAYAAPYLTLVAKNSSLVEADATLVGKFFIKEYEMNLGSKFDAIVIALSSYFEEHVPYGTEKAPGYRPKVWETWTQAVRDGYISSAGQNIQDASLKLYNNVAAAILAIDVTGNKFAEVAPLSIKVGKEEKRYVIVNYKVIRTGVSPFTQAIINNSKTLLKGDLFGGVFEVTSVKKPGKFPYYVPQSKLAGKTPKEVHDKLVETFNAVNTDAKGAQE